MKTGPCHICRVETDCASVDVTDFLCLGCNDTKLEDHVCGPLCRNPRPTPQQQPRGLRAAMDAVIIAVAGTFLGFVVGVLVIVAPRLGDRVATRLWGPGWSA